MTENNLLSICCLGYNHAPFIEANIRAIWDSGCKDIEIIAVDDGSKDNSGEILKKLQKQSPIPMKVLLQENTGNIAHNFNVAWHEAKGKYITFMALDDVLQSDKIAEAINYLEQDEKCAFVASSVITGIDNDGNICNNIPSLKLNFLKNPIIDDLLELEYLEFGAFYLQGSFFRKDIVDAVGGFDEDMLGDDIVLRTKVFRYIKQHPELSFKILTCPLCSYRQHDGNIHSNHMRQIKIVTQYLGRYWPDKPIPQILLTWAKSSCQHWLENKEIDNLKQFLELFPGLYEKTIECIFEKLQSVYDAEISRQHKMNRWRKLCGRIVKQHKTTYYFLYIPIWKKLKVKVVANA